MAFPANPANGATHRFGRVDYIYDSASKIWTRPGRVQNAVRDSWVGPFTPDRGGSIYLDKEHLPVTQSRFDDGPTNYGYDAQAEVIASFDQDGFGGADLGDDWERFSVIRIMFSMMNREWARPFVLKIRDDQTHVSDIKWNTLIRWGTHGEQNNHSVNNGEANIIPQMRQNRFFVGEMTIFNPKIHGGGTRKTITTKISGRRQSNDSGQVWHHNITVNTNRPLKSGRFQTAPASAWFISGTVIGYN